MWSLSLLEEGNTGKNPSVFIRVFALHLERRSVNVGSTTSRCAIDRTLVIALEFSVFHLDSGDVDNRHDRMELFEHHVCEVAFFATTTHFPTSSFKEVAVNIGTSCRPFGVCALIFFICNFSCDSHIIERKSSLTSSHLGDSGNVRRRVEQCRHPNANRSFEVFRPFNKLLLTHQQIIKPWVECLVRVVSIFSPHWVNLVETKFLWQGFHRISNIKYTLKTSIKISKWSSDFWKQGVHAFTFLQANNNIWGLIFSFGKNVNHLKVFRQNWQEVSNDLLNFIIRSTTTWATTRNRENSGE